MGPRTVAPGRASVAEAPIAPSRVWQSEYPESFAEAQHSLLDAVLAALDGSASQERPAKTPRRHRRPLNKDALTVTVEDADDFRGISRALAPLDFLSERDTRTASGHVETQAPGLTHAYASTANAVQGRTAARAYVLVSEVGLYRQAAYVALSREGNPERSGGLDRRGCGGPSGSQPELEQPSRRRRPGHERGRERSGQHHCPRSGWGNRIGVRGVQDGEVHRSGREGASGWRCCAVRARCREGDSP
jgi:hypothetical protein